MGHHTPGPWSVAPDFMREEHVPILSDLAGNATPRRWIVANTDNDSQGLADARLIAAAPDLLAALVQCESFARAQRTDSKTAGEWEEAERVARLAREALAKALGN